MLRNGGQADRPHAVRVPEPRLTGGALDRASPNFMGLASLRPHIGIFCDSLHSVLLLNVFLGLYFSGLAPIAAVAHRLEVPHEPVPGLAERACAPPPKTFLSRTGVVGREKLRVTTVAVIAVNLPVITTALRESPRIRRPSILRGQLFLRFFSFAAKRG